MHETGGHVVLTLVTFEGFAPPHDTQPPKAEDMLAKRHPPFKSTISASRNSKPEVAVAVIIEPEVTS